MPIARKLGIDAVRAAGYITSRRDHDGRRVALRSYVSYCTTKGVDPLPTDDASLSLTVLSWLSSPLMENKAYSTIRHYAHSVRWGLARMRGKDGVNQTDWDAVLRSLKHRAPPTNRARDAFDLKLLRGHMKSKYPVLPFALLFAAIFLLRPSEYCAATKPHHRPITWDQVRLVGDKLYVIIDWSKTNATGEPTTLCRMAQPGRTLCIVEAYKRYAASVPAEHRTGTFLKRPDGSEMDRGTLSNYIKHIAKTAGYPTDKISLYSLRKAGATRMWLATGDPVLTMREGRWKSMQSMMLYIRADPTVGASFTSAVTNVSTHASSSLQVAKSFKTS